MKEYMVIFLVQADSPEHAVNMVYDRLRDGGEADKVEETQENVQP